MISISECVCYEELSLVNEKSGSSYRRIIDCSFWLFSGSDGSVSEII